MKHLSTVLTNIVFDTCPMNLFPENSIFVKYAVGKISCTDLASEKFRKDKINEIAYHQLSTLIEIYLKTCLAHLMVSQACLISN